MTAQSDRLRRLSLNDQRYLDGQLAALTAEPSTTQLSHQCRCLARLAALFALDGAASTYGWATSEALAAGATSDELIDLLVALAPLIGSARVVAAAPKLGLALGYDVEADIEGLDAGLAS
jgi:alkylhydroperoxidase/carboxymuconolactone decarboxylase family protein YurZ